MKKNWQKPKLIVLARGRSDEHVLNTCKDGPGSPATAQDAYDSCEVGIPETGPCGLCEQNGTT